MKDEILERIKEQGGPSLGQHDFDGAVALGQWVLAERTTTREALMGGKTLGGIEIPDASQTPIWVVRTVGAKVSEQLGQAIHEGDRLLFVNPTATFVIDGRGYAVLRCSEIVAVLRIPEPQLVVPANGKVLQ